MKFQIGHPSYTGDNRSALHETHADALRDLLIRRVPMRDAQKALRQAKTGSHATCSTVRNGYRINAVEVLAK